MNYPIIFLVWILVAVASLGLYMLIARCNRKRKREDYQDFLALTITDLMVTESVGSWLEENQVHLSILNQVILNSAQQPEEFDEEFLDKYLVCWKCGNPLATDEEPYCIDCFERIKKQGLTLHQCQLCTDPIDLGEYFCQSCFEKLERDGFFE